MRRITFVLAAASGLAIAAPSMSTAAVLDFSGNICGVGGNASCTNGAQIGQNYGDTSSVNVSYRSFTTSTGLTLEAFLKSWDNGYGDLRGVVWGGSSPTNYTSEITFTPASGFEVSLTGFDAGCYLNRSSCRTLPFSIKSVGGTVINTGSASLPGGGHASIAVNSGYFTDGIVLQWGPDGYDGGLDNIVFDVRSVVNSAVPEPATWAMMIGGFGMIGGAMRRGRLARKASLA